MKAFHDNTMRNLLFAFLLITACLFSAAATAQRGLPKAPYTTFITSSDTFLISEKPVTNREYLVYLMWIYNVYGQDYPDSFFEAFPGIQITNSEKLWQEYSSTSLPLDVIFRYTPAFVRDYMFNPKYLDYPVVGVSWEQATRFCHWLSDRYNEATLMRQGYMETNFNQVAEDCFVTESYLVDQYAGLSTSKEPADWKTHILVPTFRLPEKREIVTAQKDTRTEIILYPKKSSFLDLWEKEFIQVNNGIMTLGRPTYNNVFAVISTSPVWNTNSLVYGELTLGTGENGYPGFKELCRKDQIPLTGDTMTIYSQDRKPLTVTRYNFKAKDYLGRMPFVIVDENHEGKPLMMPSETGFAPASSVPEISYYFRFVCQMRPGQYRP